MESGPGAQNDVHRHNHEPEGRWDGNPPQLRDRQSERPDESIGENGRRPVSEMGARAAADEELAVLDDGEPDQRRLGRSARRTLRSALEQRQARGTKQGSSRLAPSR